MRLRVLHNLLTFRRTVKYRTCQSKLYFSSRMNDYRVEHDSFGSVQIPQNRLWGPQTQRSIQNFNIGVTEKMPRQVIHALGLAKLAAVQVNMNEGKIPKDIGEAIAQASKEVMRGDHDEEFPLVVWQTGSGTQTNMNANEVIANRALQILGKRCGMKNEIHPNDHVNMGQSSNDTFPTAMNISAAIEVTSFLLPNLKYLASAFEQCIAAFGSIVKIGRTHLQDATPLTLGQEFGAFVCMIENGIRRIELALPQIFSLAQGATAVGTGLNTYKGFAESFAEHVSRLTSLPFRTSSNKFEALSSVGGITELSAALSTTAADFLKIANDIRLLSSGPRCGLGELILPANEPGSSIMPGKVNPTQCEALAMVCAEIIGNHTAVTVSCSHGHLQLNVFRPLIIYNVLRSIKLLGDATKSFAEKCVLNMKPNKSVIQKHLDNSLMLVTALTPFLGYDKCSKISQYAHEHNLTLKEAAVKLEYITPEMFQSLVKPDDMVHPNH